MPYMNLPLHQINMTRTNHGKRTFLYLLFTALMWPPALSKLQSPATVEIKKQNITNMEPYSSLKNINQVVQRKDTAFFW